MKVKQINRILYFVCGIGAILFAFAIFLPKNGKSLPKPFKSALLNPQYRNTVDSISIEKDGKKIALEKSGEFWLAISDDTTILAENKIVDSLLDEATKIRNLYKISAGKTSWEQLSLGEENATKITFAKKSDRVYTKSYFGVQNSITNRLALRTITTDSAYETENSFQQFLTTDINYWGIGEIFTEIENLTQVTLSIEGKTKTLSSDNEDFGAKSHDLLSLRHGKINSESSIGTEPPVASITAQSGNGRYVKIDFYKASDNPEIDYLYTKKVYPSKIDSTEAQFAFNQQKNACEVSNWTFNRIKEIFGL
ncbi:hypothetical protein [Treponema zioleckii]|uniref:hypothetical protein n=1 Tax=Treponema zioleckii TaxID=331680 RepID=UPI00168ADE75|nr:hypothetical protein [Treponema zioleckii]